MVSSDFRPYDNNNNVEKAIEKFQRKDLDNLHTYTHATFGQSCCKFVCNKGVPNRSA